jgi:hypothetical protein
MPALPAAPTRPPSLSPQAVAAPVWQAVLAAGDGELTTTDTAVIELRERLLDADIPEARLRVLSANPSRYLSDVYIQMPREALTDGANHPGRLAQLPGGIGPATPAGLALALGALDERPPHACLAFLASTPESDGLKLRDDTLTPDILDRALTQRCADAPTVVIVSACRSGAFAAPPMTRANRLIITAAPTSGEGFGCGHNRDLATFDECLIGALDATPRWTEVFDQTRRCVARRSRLLGVPVIDPPVSIGALVAGLTTPVQSRAGVTEKIEWRQGIGHFSVDGTPYYTALRNRNAKTLEAYRLSPAPKALALTLAGTVTWVAAEESSATADDVARIALQRCEWQSGGSCILYARNDSLSAADAAGDSPIHPPTLARAGRVDPALVPFIRDDQRAEVAHYLRLSGPKALALAPDSEALGIGRGPTEEVARAEALAQCKSRGAACVIYAEGEQITLAEGP